MKIAGIQFSCQNDKETNAEKALRMLDMALFEGARVVCFQELFNLPWFPKSRDEGAFALADDLDSGLIQDISQKARRSEAVVLVPFFEKTSTAYFNSCAIIDTDGSVAGVYRKIHIPDIPLWEEKFYFSPGDCGFPVFETKHGKIGIAISWDNLFPEVARTLALKGAELVFAPTACAFKSQHIWQTVITANAITNGLCIMRVNRAGSEEVQDFYGMSFCVDPEGELTAGPTGQMDGILIADVDLEQLSEVRREWPLLKERRPECYGEILEKP